MVAVWVMPPEPGDPKDMVRFSNGARVRLADVPGWSEKPSQAVLDKARAVLQGVVDGGKPQLVSDLPDDEPAKSTDPKARMGECQHYETREGKLYCLSRSVIVESVIWDGERPVLTMRNPRRDRAPELNRASYST